MTDVTTTVDEVIRARRPAVLRGFGRTWPALRSWSVDRLAHDHAALPVSVMPTEHGLLRPEPRHGFVGTSTTLGEFVARVRAGTRDPGYLSLPLDELPLSLRAAIDAPHCWDEAAFRRGKLWLSPRGVVTPLHFDAADNLHVQIRGHKTFRTCPPSDSWNVYPCSPFSGTPNFSRVDAETPDLERFPAFARARIAVHELDEGDAVYLPSGHWHHVRSVDESVSVNFWWADGVRAWMSRATDTMKRLRAVSR